MAERPWVFFHQTNLNLLFTLTVIACIANAIVTVASFVLYVRARLAPREQPPGVTDERHSQWLAELDRREQRYQALHFITLALFVLFGVLILVQLSNRLNGHPTL